MKRDTYPQPRAGQGKGKGKGRHIGLPQQGLTQRGGTDGFVREEERVRWQTQITMTKGELLDFANRHLRWPEILSLGKNATWQDLYDYCKAKMDSDQLPEQAAGPNILGLGV